MYTPGGTTDKVRVTLNFQLEEKMPDGFSRGSVTN